MRRPSCVSGFSDVAFAFDGAYRSKESLSLAQRAAFGLTMATLRQRSGCPPARIPFAARCANFADAPTRRSRARAPLPALAPSGHGPSADRRTLVGIASGAACESGVARSIRPSLRSSLPPRSSFPCSSPPRSPASCALAPVPGYAQFAAAAGGLRIRAVSIGERTYVALGRDPWTH